MVKGDANIADAPYDASKIKILGGIEAVRKRPAMYIGSTGKAGLHHLVYEVVDNSIDEALAGHCDNIQVTINKGETISVEDNGRGIPFDIHKETKRPAAEVVLTTLHAGGKFDDSAYKVSGGLHGVGVSCVNALSEWLEAEIYHGGEKYEQTFKRGVPGKEKITPIKDKDKSGTIIRFKPDPEIFTETIFEKKTVAHRLRELAYLNKGVKITFTDEREKSKDDQTEVYQFEGGIVQYVEHLNDKKEALYQPPIAFSAQKDKVFIDIAMQHCKDYYDENIFSFVNCIKTKEGGTHEVGFKSALTKAINSYARKNNVAKEEESLSGDDVREGLTAIISLKVPDPQFEGQTKTKLGNSEIKGMVDSMVNDYLSAYLDKNPAVGRAIVERALIAYRVRAAARKAQELERKKSALDTALLPGKLADCTESNAEKTELFLVEGDSAGGSAKQGRDRRFQAILPLRGKILNVEKARLDKILASQEIRTMITAIGPSVISGLSGNGEKDDVPVEEMFKKLNYHKIIIMTDADVDGAHIRTLLLTFFFRYARKLIDYGKLYIAQPPLYLVKKGKTAEYVYSDAELEKVMKRVGRDGAHIQRYKGLGEMNAEQLWDTTMNPETRTLLQVTLDDGEEADEIFKILMGTEVEPRRQFIQENAKLVKRLDV